MADDVTSILRDRGNTHGSFRDNAHIAIGLRHQFRVSPNWTNLNPQQQLALDEIALKMARLLSGGSADVPEHWNDIAGYAMLGGQACTKQN